MKVSLLGVGLLGTYPPPLALRRMLLQSRHALQLRNHHAAPSTSAAPTSSDALVKPSAPGASMPVRAPASSAAKLPSLARNTACAEQMVPTQPRPARALESSPQSTGRAIRRANRGARKQ